MHITPDPKAFSSHSETLTLGGTDPDTPVNSLESNDFWDSLLGDLHEDNDHPEAESEE